MKTINSFSLFALVALLFCVNIAKGDKWGFTPRAKEAKKAHERVMIFVKKDMSKYKSMTTKTAIQADAFNQTLEKAVKSFWNFTSSYEFKTLDEAKVLRKTDKKGYAIIFIKDYGKEDISVGANFRNPVSGMRFLGGDGEKTVLSFSLMEDWNPEEGMDITIPHTHIVVGDIYSSILLVQGMLDCAMKDEANEVMKQNRRDNLEKLKNKTLLVPKDLIASDAKFGVNYPYKYKIVSEKELTQYIQGPDSGFAYIDMFPIAYTMQAHHTGYGGGVTSGAEIPEKQLCHYFYYIFDMSDGKILVNSGQGLTPDYHDLGSSKMPRNAIGSKMGKENVQGLTKEEL